MSYRVIRDPKGNPTDVVIPYGVFHGSAAETLLDLDKKLQKKMEVHEIVSSLPLAIRVSLAKGQHPLRAFRKHYGMLQSEVARSLHTTTDMVSKYELGKCRPSVAHGVQLCDMFKLPMWMYNLFTEGHDISK